MSNEPIGWWRTPSHARKCSQAIRFNFSASVAKGHAFYRAKERRAAIRRVLLWVLGALVGLAFTLLIAGGLCLAR